MKRRGRSGMEMGSRGDEIRHKSREGQGDGEEAK